MSAEIRLLKTQREQCRSSVLETLEEVTAEADDVVGIGIAILRPDGSINTCFSDCDNVAALLGAATLLQHRLLKATEE
jgi:hypothetical protein